MKPEKMIEELDARNAEEASMKPRKTTQTKLERRRERWVTQEVKRRMRRERIRDARLKHRNKINKERLVQSGGDINACLPAWNIPKPKRRRRTGAEKRRKKRVEYLNSLHNARLVAMQQTYKGETT
jgi:hypothetical protein